ncbi:hypothetical protein EDB83DRAFT_609376 [Lactarius deliciosus]|nr:hypothetical protein EDB83DRAFT_609376 [Lactarius deliciosus]
MLHATRRDSSMLSRRALARLLKMRYRFEYVFRCLDPQVGEIYNPSLPPNMSGDNWGGRGWLNKLSWLFDASVTLAGFSDPSLSLTFPWWSRRAEDNTRGDCRRGR